MSQSTDPQPEHPSTYFVQDRSNVDELARLRVQDHMVTDGMGGVMPEQPDPASFQRILDVACGAGGWLIEVAKTYPTTSLLIGVDVSKRMIGYAQEQAEAQQVSDRVQFRTMDALRMLEFPDEYFDLVNQRFGQSFLRTWDWPKLLQEYQRVTRPGGMIRITEGDVGMETNSPAMTRLTQMFVDAFYNAGHIFSPETNSGTKELARLLSQHGLEHVQTRAHTIEYRVGTPEWQNYYEDVKLSETLLPFMRKWTQVPEDYPIIRRQALEEIQQPGFVAKLNVITAWGTKSKQ